MRFERMGKRAPPASAPHLSPETLEEARRLSPGADVYALQADWLSWWEGSGRARLSNPDRAFLGWVAKRRAEP